jgi:hypothetical protein
VASSRLEALADRREEVRAPMSEFTDRVEVEWIDSEADSSWMPLAQALYEAESEAIHRSCGFLIADTESYVLLALNVRDPIEGEKPMVADTIRIPRFAVRSITRLRKGR